MLRYKNSLLERILLEKGSTNWQRMSIMSNISTIGIDVQAELRAKTGSPHLGPTHMPQNMAQPPTVQRAIMNRHNQARRSNSAIAPKLESLAPLQPAQARPTPSSHTSSPSSMSPGFANHGVMTPPGSDSQAQFQQQQQQRLQAAKMQPVNGHVNSGLVNSAGLIGNLAPKTQANIANVNVTPAPLSNPLFPNFQNHYEQLGKLTRFLSPLSFLISWNFVS